jgi:hypothetical protein
VRNKFPPSIIQHIEPPPACFVASSARDYRRNHGQRGGESGANVPAATRHSWSILLRAPQFTCLLPDRPAVLSIQGTSRAIGKRCRVDSVVPSARFTAHPAPRRSASPCSACSQLIASLPLGRELSNDRLRKTYNESSQVFVLPLKLFQGLSDAVLPIHDDRRRLARRGVIVWMFVALTLASSELIEAGWSPSLRWQGVHRFLLSVVSRPLTHGCETHQ